MKQEEKFYKFCLRCGSTNVKITDSPAHTYFKELYLRCTDCAFSAKEFPEGTNDYIKELKKSKVKT